MQSLRAVATQPEIIDSWFEKLKAVYDLHDFYNKPSHIFNCDESGFQCEQGKCKIVCRKGSKNPKKISSSNEKTMGKWLYPIPIDFITHNENFITHKNFL